MWMTALALGFARYKLEHNGWRQPWAAADCRLDKINLAATTSMALLLRLLPFC